MHDVELSFAYSYYRGRQTHTHTNAGRQTADRHTDTVVI